MKDASQYEFDMARTGLEQVADDLTYEDKAFLARAHRREIRTWNELNGALQVSYETVLGDVAGETSRAAFIELERRLTHQCEPYQAAIILLWHMYVASYKEIKDVPGYFADILPRNRGSAGAL